MSTHTIKGFLYHVQYDWQESHDFDVHFDTSADMGSHSPNWVLVREHSLTVEIPDGFDPRPGKIAALEEMKRAARADFAKRITELDEQINKLLAIECTGTARLAEVTEGQCS